MKFDFCIGNPPYQETTESESTRMPPVYDKFMDAAVTIADCVELITPARFLFDGGFTSHEWNQKMLNDPHFKVEHYEPDCTKVFANTDIKGGVAITYRDSNKLFDPIVVFTKYPMLNKILATVMRLKGRSISDIIFPPLNYKLSDKMMLDHPNTIGRLRTNSFSALKEIFFETIPTDNHDYVKMIGMLDTKRISRYIRKDYIKDTNRLLDKYNVVMAVVNGSGEYGEELSRHMIAAPGVAYTQSFMGIGKCSTIEEAESIAKYIKTKFCRALLGVMKITQHCSAGVWKYVPLQNFTDASDIDWSQSISDIDKQLYRKYNLSKEEIDFIETHVKEMK